MRKGKDEGKVETTNTRRIREEPRAGEIRSGTRADAAEHNTARSAGEITREVSVGASSAREKRKEKQKRKERRISIRQKENREESVERGWWVGEGDLGRGEAKGKKMRWPSIRFWPKGGWRLRRGEGAANSK